ncbi:hypothetical protein D3C84_571920 [compost metagenome]
MAPGLLAQGETYLAADAFDEVERKVTVLLARRADAEQRHIRGGDGLGHIGSTPQQTRLDALLQQFLQTRLDDGGLPLVDQRDLGRRDIHANDFMTPCGKTAGADRADIAEPENAQTHFYSP